MHITKKRAVLTGLLLVGIFALLPTAPAFAAETDGAVVIAPFDITFIDLLRLAIIPLVLPALVGLVNRIATLPAFVKRLLLAILALASNVALEVVAASESGEPYNLWWALFLGLIAYGFAELTYQGLYKAPLTKNTVKMELAPDGTWVAPTLASKLAGK